MPPSRAARRRSPWPVRAPRSHPAPTRTQPARRSGRQGHGEQGRGRRKAAGAGTMRAWGAGRDPLAYSFARSTSGCFSLSSQS